MTKFFAKNISHLTDARYFSAMGVEWMSFLLGGKGISVPAFHGIVEWIEGPNIAIEGTSDTSILSEYTSIKEAGFIDPSEENILQIGVDMWSQAPYDLEAKAVLLTATTIGEIRDHAVFLGEQTTPYFLDANFSNEELITIAKEIPNLGIAILGSSEEKLGFKDFDEIDQLFEALGYD